MGRHIVFEVPTDTSQFTWLQLQPKSLLSLCWNGYARWLREYLVSLPKLIRNDGYGTVILDVDIEYIDALTFFDADTLEIDVALRARRRGTRLELTCNFRGGGKQAATVAILLCPVKIKDQETLTAAPEPLSSDILGRFQSDEVDEDAPIRQVPELVKRIEAEGRILGERKHSFQVHHHICEAAEQWSFIEVPNIAESLRESLALEKISSEPSFRMCLDQPLQRINIELYQPYFVYDYGHITTQAYDWNTGIAFLHRLGSDRVDRPLHGVAIERYF